MTTIFADAKKGVMVCDSMVSSEEQWFEEDKVCRVGDELIGFAGRASECERWISWYSTGQNGPMPKILNSYALILSPSGLRMLQADGGLVSISRGFFGIGSGGVAATGAFLACRDAKRAVQIACEIDPSSGGAIRVHKLKA